MRGAGDPSLRLKSGSSQDDASKRFKLSHYGLAGYLRVFPTSIKVQAD
jgi:hypothetical protein